MLVNYLSLSLVLAMNFIPCDFIIQVWFTSETSVMYVCLWLKPQHIFSLIVQVECISIQKQIVQSTHTKKPYLFENAQRFVI